MENVKLTAEQRSVVVEAIMAERSRVSAELAAARKALNVSFKVLKDHRYWDIGTCDSIGEALALEVRAINLAAAARQYKEKLGELERIEESRKVVRELPVERPSNVLDRATESVHEKLDSVAEEIAAAAIWLAQRGYKGDEGDPLPDALSAEASKSINSNPVAFKEAVRLTAEALGKEGM